MNIGLVHFQRSPAHPIWTRSAKTIDWADKVPTTTSVIALTGKKDGNTLPSQARETMSRWIWRK